MENITGYSDYYGFGWVRFGRLVVNYAGHRAYRVAINYADGTSEVLWER